MAGSSLLTKYLELRKRGYRLHHTLTLQSGLQKQDAEPICARQITTKLELPLLDLLLGTAAVAALVWLCTPEK